MPQNLLPKTYALFETAFNKGLIEKLRASGEELFLLSPMQPEELEMQQETIEGLKNISKYDWLILTDIFAAEILLETLQSCEIDLYELDLLTVCAVGEAVADRLRFRQLHADVIPPLTSDQAVLAAILQYSNETIEDQKILLIRAENSTSKFREELILRGAKVDEIEIYRQRIEEDFSQIKFKTLLKGGAIDEIIFTLAEDILSLRCILNETELEESLEEVKISATNEVVFQSLQENKLRPLYFHAG